MNIKKDYFSSPKNICTKEDDKSVNLFIIGDSIAYTFPASSYPYQGWGTFLGNYFKDEIKVINHAHNGWSSKAFLKVGFLNKYPQKSCWDIIKSEFKQGDWLLIALGINDCSLTNPNRTNEEEYEANLTLFTNEARQLGVNVLFMTQTILGGDNNSEKGWDFSLPKDDTAIEDAPMEQRWVKRAECLKSIGKKLNVPVIELGKYLSCLYENMYQDYMKQNPKATAADGRNYVRYQFNIYNDYVNKPITEGGLGMVRTASDDSTHLNIKGAQKIAKIIANLISKSDTSLSSYVKDEGYLKKTNLYIMSDSMADKYNIKDFYPLQGWGTFLSDNIKDELTVHNFARNGWSTKSFLTKGYDKNYPNQTLWSVMHDEMKEGDWLLLALGVNDCSLINPSRTTEEEYRENITLITNQARQKGANVIYMTPAIKGGLDGSEDGWEYKLPPEDISIEDAPMKQRWVKRSECLKKISMDLNVPVIELGKYLTEYYEAMYTLIKNEKAQMSIADARNEVRYHFNLYLKKINTPISEGGFGENRKTDSDIKSDSSDINAKKEYAAKRTEDDDTHLNIKGAREYASIISYLISKSDTELSKYMSSLIDIF